MNTHNTSQCQGNCIELYGGHNGLAADVHVQGWGMFIYCENAIEEDERRGLKVQSFEGWLIENHINIFDRYSLTQIKLPTMMFYMNPTVQAAWEEYSGEKPKQPREY